MQAARQATLPRGSDDFGIFFTHVTTFHDIRMTLTKTNGEDTLMTPTTGGEDTLTIPFTTHD